MKIRRGLFRLWVLFSGLWILACVSIAAVGGQWFAGYSVYEISDPNSGKYVVEAPANASLTEVADYATKTAGPSARSACKEHPEPWCDDPISLKMPRAYGFKKSAMIVVLPRNRS